MAVKKLPKKKTTGQKLQAPVHSNVQTEILRPSIIEKLKSRLRGPVSQSPHRSFYRTKQRDYIRTLNMPGYITFTSSVWRTLWQYKTTFGLLVVVYSFASGLLVGMASQATYTQLADLLRTSSGDVFEGSLGRVGEAGSLLLAGLSGGLNPTATELQQFLGGLLVLMVWLTTVWLLRAFTAGSRPRLRDGLYNAGAPIVPTILVSLLLIVQLIPAALAAIGFSAILPTGLLNQGAEAMLFWAVAILLLLLSLYWITATMMALVVVTLPGMYPMQALRAASDLVLGRRFRLLLRIVWLGFVTLLAFAIIMIPIILVDSWLKGLLPSIEWMPIVPSSLLIVSAASTVWSAAYIYFLYRKVVDNDAEE